MYVDVSFPISSYQVFSYKIPRKFIDSVKVGQRIKAPLGNRIGQGIIVAIDTKPTFSGNIKELTDIIDLKPIVDENLWTLIKWLSKYYKTPLGQCAKMVLPQNLNLNYQPPKKYFVQYLSGDKDIDLNGNAQKKIFKYIFESKEEIAINDLKNLASNPLLICKKLSEKGFIKLYSKKQIPPKLELFANKKQSKIEFNKEQKVANDKILKYIKTNKFHSILLHGVTGSGKTEIYIKAVKEIIKRNKTAILILPEITLAPQIANKFSNVFGDQIAVWHSKLSPAQRSYYWKNICSGNFKIVIGARSAIFTPLKKIGLIIVDEEHESSYKQEHSVPKYHARDVSLMRGRISNATVILGSATPSLESIYNQLNGKSKYIQLKSRFGKAILPKVHLVDMLKESEENYGNPISDLLKEKIDQRLSKGEQIILLHNRRGFSPISKCLDCGYIESCPSCCTSLSYHKIGNMMRCHLCNYSKKGAAIICIKCKSQRIKLSGSGTQKVEEILSDQFANAKISRLDVDTATSDKNIHRIMRSFLNKEIDILVGTQMIAKGLDFPNVTLVGIINADIGLFLPDFRAGEKIFQLIYQASGRSGRGELPGEVVIQSYNSNDKIIKLASKLMFKDYANEALKERELLYYPPYSWLAKIELRAKNKDKLLRMMNFINGKTKGINDVFFLGPSLCYREKLNGYHRAHLIIKSLKKTDPNGLILDNISDLLYSSIIDQKKIKSTDIFIDKNPISLL